MQGFIRMYQWMHGHALHVLLVFSEPKGCIGGDI